MFLPSSEPGLLVHLSCLMKLPRAPAGISKHKALRLSRSMSEVITVVVTVPTVVYFQLQNIWRSSQEEITGYGGSLFRHRNKFSFPGLGQATRPAGYKSLQWLSALANCFSNKISFRSLSLLLVLSVVALNYGVLFSKPVSSISTHALQTQSLFRGFYDLMDNAWVIPWILAMAGFTIAEAAASARALLAASPPSSSEAPDTGELVTEWLKITLVPLFVFLIGACLWRCIKKSPAWKMLTDDKGSARNGGVDSAPTADSNNGSIDLEAGMELSHSVAVMATAALTNVESTDEAAATDSTPTDETTSDIGNG